MASKTKYDPLEAAKVTADTKGKDDLTLARTDWDTTDTPPPAPAVEVKPQPASMPPPRAAEAPAPQVAMFEVLEDRVASVGKGGMHRFKRGDLLNAHSYGGEDRLKAMGLKVRKVEI